ncbi:aminotransferase class I/II-fold pyridoxal phosphate-dependent enzyme [Salinibius halmophilus]|uniref:aminotransferase class I/II-fold pyridoxal phosphate-dependent enzyme n=1 Tax=Salinibius halmophilus TaxID=1853216 RepID=UPI000E672C3A|nr:aminotransferase class I/II-fold pyridoxal phosphate-dependent enzyme [Salinibius halmophilus]
MPQESFLDLAEKSLSNGAKRGVLHLYHDGDEFNGRHVDVDGAMLLNFGSCSYLGLEKHPTLVDACCRAAKAYGTQLSSSRAYMSSGQYRRLETLLSDLFAKPVLVTPTTSLGHLAAFQSLIEPHDLIVLDQQAHASLHAAAQYMKGAGVQTQLIRHNNLQQLERLLVKHRQQTVWYCLDGVYSMYGDWAPIEALYKLADQYPHLMLYADDAHGFSWYGERGLGTVRGRVERHKQMVLAVSLNKAFGCAGGALVFANQAQYQRVRTVGNALVFSGPIQPPMLGAAIASAELHFTTEFAALQSELADKIALTEKLIEHHQLPDLSHANTPIFFIAISSLEAGYAIVKNMMASGFYLNLGLFPAVSIHHTGIRITINNHLAPDDIKDMMACLAECYQRASNEFKITESVLSQAFKQSLQSPLLAQQSDSELRLQVLAQMPYDWDDYCSDEMTKSGKLGAIHAAMKGPEPENLWQLRYIRIYFGQQLLLQAVVTKSLNKTDMFMPKHISEKAERLRQSAPYAFSQNVLMLGTPISEGEAIWVNDHHRLFESVLELFCQTMVSLKETLGCEAIVLRDFSKQDTLFSKLSQLGYLPVQVHDRHVFEQPESYMTEQYFARLGKKNRQHWQKSIGSNLPAFQQHELTELSSLQLTQFYQQYLEVQGRAREITCFALPLALFAQMNQLPNAEWLVGYHQDQLAYAVLVLRIKKGIQPIVIGMDYQLQPFGVYRVAMHHIYSHAKALNAQQIDMGFGASFEKRRLGATPVATYHLVQVDDQFETQALEAL